MRHKTSQTLFAYWDEVRGDRPAPRRFEIDPARIAGILPYTFILERLDADTFRYRLAGTRMCEIIGAELRGADFLQDWSEEDRAPLLRQIRVVAQQAAVAIVHMEAAARSEEAVACELLLLPLRHTKDTIDRILGCFGPLEAPGWLGDKPLVMRRLLKNELIWPGRNSRTTITQPAAEAPALSSARDARIIRSERRQFRVYDGGLSRPESEKL